MIKANASSVISNLGGGQHGHLGLIIPDTEYNRTIGYTYTKPSHPGDLKIAENSQLHKAIIIRELHNKNQIFPVKPLQLKVQSKAKSLQQLTLSI